MLQKCEFDNIHLLLISSNSLVYFTIQYNNTLWRWNFYGNYEKKVQTVIDQNIKNQEFKGIHKHFIGHQSTEIDIIEINKSMLQKCILH